MMDNERVERIRARAHAIWEKEGRPEGRDVEHWQRAISEIDAVDAGSLSEAGGAAAREPSRPRTTGSESGRKSAGKATPASRNVPTAAREGGVDPVPRRASKASSGSGKGAAASPSRTAPTAAREGGVEPVPRRGSKTSKTAAGDSGAEASPEGKKAMRAAGTARRMIDKLKSSISRDRSREPS
jgi:hypothetical protein